MDRGAYLLEMCYMTIPQSDPEVCDSIDGRKCASSWWRFSITATVCDNPAESSYLGE
jgi:hypothetical protein